MNKKLPKDKLRQAYAEVLRGSSITIDDKYGLIYIKHLSVWDTEMLDERREIYFNDATKKGLPTTKEKTELLKKDDLWSDQKERDLQEKRDFISRMSQTKSKLILKSEINQIEEEIKKTEKKIDEITTEKAQLIGLTSELYADKRVNDYYVYLTLCKNKRLDVPLFTEEEFDELSDVELSRLVSIYNVVANKFSEYNMKRMALSGFFMNNYYLCKDNPFIFFGKPLVEMTYHQTDLFSYGRYFKHVLSEMKNQPSPDIMEDPDKLLEQYNIQQNQEKLQDGREQTGTASTVVGATKEDLEALGMTKESAVGDGNVVDLNEEIRKKGGTLSMEDMIKLHGV